MWTTPHQNITEAPILTSVLEATGLFTTSEVVEILAAAGEQEWKDALTQNTRTALEKGAFGAPWMWVTNSEGKEEPFFGSDRWHFLWMFLGVGCSDLEVWPKGETQGKERKGRGDEKL